MITNVDLQLVGACDLPEGRDWCVVLADRPILFMKASKATIELEAEALRSFRATRKRVI